MRRGRPEQLADASRGRRRSPWPGRLLAALACSGISLPVGARTLAPDNLVPTAVAGAALQPVALPLADAKSVARAPRHGDAPLPGLGGALELTDTSGQAWSTGRLRGRPALLFFGFAHCSRSCPVALAIARQVLAQSSPDRAPAVIFATLDPLSDDGPRLREFLDRFDRRMVGLTGTPAQVERTADRYGVGRDGPSATLAHSARWYLLDAHGRVVRTYASSTAAEELRDDIQRISGG